MQHNEFGGQGWQNTQTEGQKPSPFADSPYVVEQTRYIPQTAIEEKTGRKKGGKAGKRILCVLLVVVLMVATALATAAVFGWQMRGSTQALAEANDVIDRLEARLDRLEKQYGSAFVPEGDTGTGDALSPAGVYAANVDAVVAISNQSTSTNIFGQVSQTASSGSGFIISADGYVVSNYHVVAGATTLKVITSDGVEYKAALVGYDAANDISVLKIDGKDLPYVKIGSSDALAVGERVAAIGNPLGELTSTLTVGYVSAKDRSVNTDGTAINMIQTDAAINSGNSGGPLFNMYGEVVGITTAKYSGTSGSGATIEGIGFAIPIDDVAGMIEDIRENGYVTGAYLGVMVQDVSADAVQLYGFPMGALVMEVTDGSCAQKAGIQAKDVIVDIGGHEVDSVSGLTRALRNFEAGETTQVIVYRAGAEVTVSVVFDEKPVTQDTGVQQTPEQPDPDFGDSYDDWFGGFWPFG